MRLSNRLTTKYIRGMQRILSLLLVGLILGQYIPVQAEALGKQIKNVTDNWLMPLLSASNETNKNLRTIAPQTQETFQQRLARVSSLRLCPRRLKLYIGESFTLSPLALDSNGKIIHGTNPSWQSATSSVASVDSTGEVLALSTGSTTLTVTVGNATATVSVTVQSGVRPNLTDAQGDEEHKDDCSNVASSSLLKSPDQLLAVAGIRDKANEQDEDLKSRLKPAALRLKGELAEKQKAIKAASFAPPIPVRAGGVYFNVPPPDGESPDYSNSTSATAPYNAIGNPPHLPQEEMGEGATRMKRNLGSDNYSFTAPILSLSGRGLGVNLAMTYNSRLWNKESSQMQFNFNKGWPAAGWTLGYGRLIRNYDGSSLINYLLIQPDGTRIRLERIPNTEFCESRDGSFIRLNTNNHNLLYPDGTRVNYVVQNQRYLPNDIRTRNGDKIVITYKQYRVDVPVTDPRYFPSRWSIDYITDSLGRVIKFYYYGNSGYPEDDVNGKPKYALAAISAPDQSPGGDKVIVQLDYQAVTISTNFSVTTVGAPATLAAVRRIIYPETGRGYLFENFSSYGMAKKISARKDMRGANNTFTDGTAIAYTEYNYQDTGSLDDAPGYIDRKEWWLGKTNSEGVADNDPAVYLYNRKRANGTIEVTYPGGIRKVKTFTDNDPLSGTYGLTTKTETKDSNDTLLQKIEYTYAFLSGGGVNIFRLDATNEANETSTTGYVYGNYGRVTEINEYGYSYPTILRKTAYEYIDDADYITDRLLRLVKWTRVYQGSSQLVAQSRNFYDDYSNSSYPGPGGSGLKTYTNWNLAPNHAPSFDNMYVRRGNITRVNNYNDVSNSGAFIESWAKYDVFGNAVEVTVSCCNLKQVAFSDAHWFARADSTTDGNAAASPHLTTGYLYDFNTGLVNQMTDPNGAVTSYEYDSAWRLNKVTSPTLATTVTNFDKDLYNNDQLSSFQRATYSDDGTNKIITSRSWFDGAGRVLRSGTGEQTNPSTYDMTRVIYDNLGRIIKRSNPYPGDQDGVGTPSYYTVNGYDALFRLNQVTLPDTQTVTTDYLGSQVTVTDQVGRKRRSLLDGLGRVIRVDEQDTTGNLGTVASPTQSTAYTYDALNNLTQINQGGQLRKYKYDALSRLLFEKTPEQSATIDDGTSTFWSTKYEYTASGDMLKRTDARQVETHFQYDSLNRAIQIWYTGVGGNDSGSMRPALPSGIEATSDVNISYKSSGAGNGQVDTMSNGSVTETFGYDSIGRTASVTRTFPGNSNSYQTQYEYNAGGQLSAIIYPSLKRVKSTYDLRSRLKKVDKYDGSTFQSNYLSDMVYNTAGQATDFSLGNGVAEHFDYSPDRLQLIKQTATKNSNVLMRLNYKYQAAAGENGAGTTAGNSGQLMGVVDISGQLSQINGLSRTQAFTYDNVGRLKTAKGWNSATDRRFDYDRFGNRTGVWNVATPTGGTQIQSVSLDQSGGIPTNRLLSVTNNGTPSSYQYDNGTTGTGNVTNDGQNSYSYDANNRLVKVNSGAAVYEYDATNRRVKKTVGTSVIYYIWEGNHVIAEYGTGQSSGGLRFYHADRLSTRMITNIVIPKIFPCF